jgi:hypothetical protein
MVSCGLPGSSGGPPSNAPCMTLLQVGFAEPPGSPRALVVSYTAVSPLPGAEAPGGLLSVALSRGLKYSCTKIYRQRGGASARATLPNTQMGIMRGLNASQEVNGLLHRTHKTPNKRHPDYSFCDEGGPHGNATGAPHFSILTQEARGAAEPRLPNFFAMQ